MITVEYCGYHTHNPDRDRIYRPSGTSSYLFLLILSPMTFYFQDRPAQKARPGACILYTPGYYQHYQAEKDFFNSYIHFFCGEDLVDGYDICKNQLFYPGNTEEIHWILKKIFGEYLNRISGCEQMMDSYVRQLLITLYRGQQERVPYKHLESIYGEMLALRGQMLGECERPWTVEELCNILNIGKSKLYKYYTLLFHSTPREDLIQARIQKAKYLLSNEAVSIKQAAYEAGFTDICHFNRMFRGQCGCTPGEYRRQLHEQLSLPDMLPPHIGG